MRWRRGGAEGGKEITLAPLIPGVKPARLYASFTRPGIVSGSTAMITPSATPPTTGRPTEPLHGTSSGAGLPPPSAAKPKAAEAEAASAWPNPSLRLDPALGIIVMEFRNKSGGVESTLPTQRELDAYRSAASRGHPDSAGTTEPGAPRHAPVAPTAGQAHLTLGR